MNGGTLANYLPGCYANLRPEGDESLPGFLLRLAEQNRYAGISAFLRAVLPEVPEVSLRRQLSAVRQSATHLARLGRVACGDETALLAFQRRSIGSEAVWMHDCRVPLDGLNLATVAVCPHCLEEHGHCREAWELSPVVVCPVHECVLISSCSQCNQPLRWERSSIYRCGHCSASLVAGAEPAAPVSPAECRLAEDFSALAGFRVELNRGETATTSWEGMFSIVRALAQAPEAWLSHEFSDLIDFAGLPIAGRRSVLARIARCRNEQASYVLPALQPFVREMVALVSHFAPEDYVAQLARTFLMDCERLMFEVAEALAGPPELFPALGGAAQFGGRPPALSKPREIADFVGVGMEAFRALRRAGRVPTRTTTDDLGVDIDDLLRLRHFVAHRLAGLAAIRRMVGLAVNWDDLCLFPIRLNWEPMRQLEKRVPYDELRAAQLLLARRIRGMAVPERPVPLAALVEGHPSPFLMLSSLVAELLNGRFGPMRWPAPFRWVDIELDEREVAAHFPSLPVTRDAVLERHRDWRTREYHAGARDIGKRTHRL